ncbi:MAG: methionine--tRNA ligase [Actinobacteria bacterium]|nr:methionine--tRNA ligase [Actinomycetota bacterium]MBU1944162.1 methionine--tRNA ligase [Actinomycetota bacterium]MBU2687481.1 methionine--tRNA ligase [Actinomycetota bacterium]
MGDIFYVTTPIYYVNAEPHIGTAYTTVAADVIARYQRLKGREVFFLTGTDEHGQKVALAAAERNESPQAWVDRVVAHYRDAWDLLDISNDDFIRTTQNRHTRVAQEFIQKLQESGDVYLSSYEGWYCVHDESFLLSSQLADGQCPECRRPVDWVKEENYFFRLSRYADRVLAHIEENPDFVQPEGRRNEVVSFIKAGLADQSISRTSFTWGIPLPFDQRHVMYVWFDALLNYISAIDYGTDPARFERTWPADWHLVGKEILRFHAVIWPAMLMAAGLPLPRHVFAHGWLTVEGRKMSKSLGNVVKPSELVSEYGVDAYRYYFMREFSFGVDGNFSRRTMTRRYNDELANDLGNLESRVQTMVDKYRAGRAPEPRTPGAEENTLAEKAAETFASFEAKMERLAFNDALSDVWEFIHAVNRYVDVSAPWALARDEAKAADLDRVLYNSCEGLRQIALMVAPFMPRAMGEMWRRLGLGELADARIPADAAWGGMPAGAECVRGQALFPRLQE